MDSLNKNSTHFSIPEENIPRFQSVMARINKRANKLGFPNIVYVIGAATVRPVYNETGPAFEANRTSFIQVHDVMVEGQQPVLGDWKFLGKIEHIPGTSETIVKGDVPKQYFECAPNCDHCEKKRARSETFILSHKDTDELKQVGRSCLQDFFNGDNPMAHAAMLQLVFNVEDELRDLEEGDYESGGSTVFEVKEVLLRAAAEIRVNGWVSSGKAEELNCESTSRIVRFSFSGKGRSELPDVTVEDQDKVDKVIAWLSTDEVRSKKSESPYLHNLCVLADAQFVGRKNIGMMASAVYSYDRILVERKHQEALNASHIGTINAKLVDLAVTVEAKIFIDNNYGGKTLHKFSDADGNQIAWFASGSSPVNVGDLVHINATIKDHEEFRNCKQTVVLRVTTNEDKVFAAVADQKGVKALNKVLALPVNLNHLNHYKHITPLMLAASQGDHQVVDLLLEAGAEVDAVDMYGNTAAHFAAADVNERVLNVLKEYGANMEHRGVANVTPEDQLKVGQRELIQKVSKYQDKCVDDYGRCDPHQVAWRTDLAFPITLISGLRADWIEWYIEECARLEADGKSDLVESLASGQIEKPIVVLNRDGKLFIWDGHRRIGSAMRNGNESIPAIVGDYQPVLVLENNMTNFVKLATSEGRFSP